MAPLFDDSPLTMGRKIHVALAGAGGVASSMAPALAACPDITITRIFSRQRSHAERLCRRVAAISDTPPQPTDDISHLLADSPADVVLLAVADDAIAAIANAIDDNGALWLHTSGSVPLDVLTKRHSRCGVLYPLQSFSRNVEVDMAEVPLFVEGNSTADLRQVRRLAEHLSHCVSEADSNNRRQLHLAAVFACNFANHLWTIADELMTECGQDFDTLMPLIRSTVNKLDNLSPAQSQTGPAVRGDRRVMAAHEAMLRTDLRDIYRLLSQHIYHYHHPTDTPDD